MFSVFSLILLAMLVMQNLWHQKVVESMMARQAVILNAQTKESTKALKLMTDLNEKAQALIASGDPLVYQQIQAMSQGLDYSGVRDYDPSDEAEIEKITKRNSNLSAGEDVDAQEFRELQAEFG